MKLRLGQDSLPGYACHLVSAVLDRTDYALVLSQEEGVGYDSELRIARPARPYHEIAFVPEYRDFCLHFLVNGAFKILRLWDVPPEERHVPASRRDRGLPAEDFEELQQKMPGFPSSQLEELSKYLHQGITRQLTSMPVDIRVERDIASEIPEHRPAQRAYLARQVRDLEPHFLPDIAEVAPTRIYAASTAMNIVLAEEASDISGTPSAEVFRETPHRALGERLQCLLSSVDESGYPGDRMATDAWADELRMRDWYRWVRLDDLR